VGHGSEGEVKEAKITSIAEQRDENMADGLRRGMLVLRSNPCGGGPIEGSGVARHQQSEKAVHYGFGTNFEGSSPFRILLIADPI